MLSVHLSVTLAVNLCINLSVNLSINLYINLYSLSINLSINLYSINPFHRPNILPVEKNLQGNCVLLCFRKTNHTLAGI